MKREEVEKLAELARIKIAPKELDELTKDIESILSYVSEIQNVAAEAPAPALGEHYNVAREDKEPHERGLYTKDVLEEAPSQKDNFIKVKRILP